MKRIKDNFRREVYVKNETIHFFLSLGYQTYSNLVVPIEKVNLSVKHPDLVVEKDGSFILVEFRFASYKEDLLSFDVGQIENIKKETILPNSKLLVVTDKKLPWGLQFFQKDPDVAIIRIGEADKYYGLVSVESLKQGILDYLFKNS